jgi:hypothetical protein
VLLKTQKRVMQSGRGLKLVNVNRHIHDIFRYAGFDPDAPPALRDWYREAFECGREGPHALP